LNLLSKERLVRERSAELLREAYVNCSAICDGVKERGRGEEMRKKTGVCRIRGDKEDGSGGRRG